MSGYSSDEYMEIQGIGRVPMDPSLQKPEESTEQESKTDENTNGDTPEEEPSSIQKFVWLVQGLGITMPPVAEVYVKTILEFSSEINENTDIEAEKAAGKEVFMIFATREELIKLTTNANVKEYLNTKGWPVAGMAAGFVAKKESGVWFYVMVSEQQILLVSIKIDFESDVTIELGKSMASMANILLEEHLTKEVNAARALSSLPIDIRKIVSYSNDDGLPAEKNALWDNLNSTLSEFMPSYGYFVPKPASEDEEEEMPSIRA